MSGDLCTNRFGTQAWLGFCIDTEILYLWVGVGACLKMEKPSNWLVSYLLKPEHLKKRSIDFQTHPYKPMLPQGYRRVYRLVFISYMGHTASSCLTDSNYILASPRNVLVVETSLWRLSMMATRYMSLPCPWILVAWIQLWMKIAIWLPQFHTQVHSMCMVLIKVYVLPLLFLFQFLSLQYLECLSKLLVSLQPILTVLSYCQNVFQNLD